MPRKQDDNCNDSAMVSTLEACSLLPTPQPFDEKTAFAGDEYGLSDLEQKSRRSRRSSIIRTIYTIYTVVLTFVLAIVAAQSAFEHLSDKRSKWTAENPFPDMPFESIKWEPDPDFDPDMFRASMNGSVTDVGWSTLGLTDGYWLEMPLDAAKGVQGGLPPTWFNSSSTTTGAFVPSLHHQLHCLIQLNILVTGLEYPVVTEEHASHCIELIRQALLCSADLSLEGPSVVTEEKWNGPDGWGGTHLCKDRAAVDEVVRTYGIPQAALARPPPEPSLAS